MAIHRGIYFLFFYFFFIGSAVCDLAKERGRYLHPWYWMKDEKQEGSCKSVIRGYHVAHVANFGWLSDQDQLWFILETTLHHQSLATRLHLKSRVTTLCVAKSNVKFFACFRDHPLKSLPKGQSK
jgi:hypothetical protein